MEFQDELAKVLNEMGLPSAVIQLETSPAGKVGGYIVSTGFDGMPQIDRQNMVWDYLDRVLPKDRQIRIISLLTLTPDEADMAA